MTFYMNKQLTLHKAGVSMAQVSIKSSSLIRVADGDLLATVPNWHWLVSSRISRPNFSVCLGPQGVRTKFDPLINAMVFDVVLY